MTVLHDVDDTLATAIPALHRLLFNHPILVERLFDFFPPTLWDSLCVVSRHLAKTTSRKVYLLRLRYKEYGLIFRHKKEDG